MGGKEDCNVCMFSVTWYEEEAWEKEHSKSAKKNLRNGFVATASGMSVYCKLHKKFYPPSYWCKQWKDIKFKK